jgi:hypothetical protein
MKANLGHTLTAGMACLVSLSGFIAVLFLASRTVLGM